MHLLSRHWIKLINTVFQTFSTCEKSQLDNKVKWPVYKGRQIREDTEKCSLIIFDLFIFEDKINNVSYVYACVCFIVQRKKSKKIPTWPPFLPMLSGKEIRIKTTGHRKTLW